MFLERLDENLVDQYLSKFETKNNTYNVIENEDNLIGDDLKLTEEELYSDACNLSSNQRKSSRIRTNKNRDENGGENGEEEEEEDEDDEEDSDDDDIDEKLLLEKNFFNVNDSDELKENEDELYTCEICSNHAYKHLTQLKVSKIELHLQYFV